ncbi:recombinase zinc beta ribbon domain-containing protein [Streptomyces sp. BP-8]|uniref:Zinc ribbon domain-containing protein n=1 Tax=Streptomyces sirii TaxID=3127701 RepID=A0ABZ2QGA9_9ACTN
MIERLYDGCGKCLVGLRRLSRKTDATSSPERRRDHVLAVTKEYGGHIIAWADDWEVSGGTDPMTRPAFGPWLRGERGSAQFELRAIQRRNRDQAAKARAAGRPHGKPSYGYEYVRLSPTSGVDHVRLSPDAAATRRSLAKRILADPESVSPWTEAARLTRAGVLAPSDHVRVLHGREPKGTPWYGSTVTRLLLSKAALGYLMHKGEPVVGDDGHPVRLPGADGQPVEQLWDYPTHLQLVEVLSRRAQPGKRRTKGVRLLSGRVLCGVCGNLMKINSSGTLEKGDVRRRYICEARLRGYPNADHCRPAPGITASMLDEIVTH